MSDFNILNRASFDDKQLRYVLKVQPFIHEGHGTLDLKGLHNVFWIKQIKWSFNYKDVGVRNARPARPKPIQVTVADILENEEKPYPPFIQPKPVVGRIPFKVINTNIDNNHQLIVTFFIDGVLVKPRSDAKIGLKEMLGYIMMGSDKRGELAMAEAVTDKLDQQFTDLGLGSIRDKFPGGLGAFNQLPAPIQGIVINAMVQKGDLPALALGSVSHLGSSPMALGNQGNQGQPPLALAEIDPDREISSFIGDMVSNDISVSTEELKQFAKQMIEKGWRKV
jgi:hypothetical protein